MDRPPKLVRRRRSARSHSAKTEILKFDHWIYGDLADSVEIKFNNGTIESNEIGSWLCQPSPTTYYKSDWRQPCAGLRLLCRKHEHSTAKPFDDETMRAINDAMGISSSHSYITRHDAGICGKYMSTSQQPVFVYHRSNNNSTLSVVLRYDYEINVTMGYILVGPDISTEDVRVAIETQFAHFSHPLIIPILLSELTAINLMGKLNLVHTDLANIEDETGFGDWGAKSTEKELSSQNYRKLARDLGKLDSRFAFIDVAIQCTTMVAEFTKREIDSMKCYIPPSKFHSLKGIIPSLSDRAEALSSNLKHMQAFAGISLRVRAQQNVIFSLIAQQDNLLNAGIAQDSKELTAASKRDSAAMKIIAILTTLFLPATFVSTFFAMPLFNWAAESMQQVMTDHFWIYWAIAGPLTLVVMGVVIAFTIYQSRQRKTEMEEARKGAGLSIV